MALTQIFTTRSGIRRRRRADSFAEWTMRGWTLSHIEAEFRILSSVFVMLSRGTGHTGASLEATVRS